MQCKKKRTSRARKKQKYAERETGRKTRARAKISFQINDNYIELKTKIYNYAKRQIRQINRMPNTHTLQPNMQGIYTTNL